MNASASLAPTDGADPSACCTEDEVIALVQRFYQRVRQDEELGPIFGHHIRDWDAHLATMVDFWSGTLRGTGRFRGAPMGKHMALPGLKPALFRRWLALFSQTTAELGNPVMKREADARAAAIAMRFWERYKIEGHDVLAARR